MTTQTPDPDDDGGRRAGPDEPDTDNPLTPEDILAEAGAEEALDKLPAKEAQATRLVTLAKFHYQLVKGDDGRPYAVAHDGPGLAVSLKGRDGLRQRLASLYYDAYGQAPGGSGLTDALTVLEGQAERTDPTPVALRVAAAGDGRIAIDLGRADGRSVLVGPDGWAIQSRAPVLFRRSTLTAPLPDPTPGGSLDGLRRLVNVDETRWRLIVAWLVAALVPDIPHPILALTGEQGTAKSTAARFVVELVDASPAPLRTPPADLESWAAGANASWVVALDNVSSIPAWFSDTLCKAVTGDGLVTRARYTDDDLSILTFRRCIALTSIDAGQLAGDLAERMLPIELDRIPPGRRRTDAEVADAYQQARPASFGALLDLTAQVLRTLPTIQLTEAPRMADFARILAALDHTCGWDTLADYTAAAAEANRNVLEADPIAEAVCALVGPGGGWQGTATELLERITPERPPRKWPRSPQAISGALKRLAPALRGQGIHVEFDREGRTSRKVITLRADPQ